MRQLIEDYLNSEGKTFTKEELKKKLHIKGEEATEEFDLVLKKLVEDGIVYQDNNKYRIFDDTIGLLYGNIKINRFGNGYVTTDDNKNIFIPNDLLNGSLDGDIVLVSPLNYNKKNLLEGSVSKILKRDKGILLLNVIKVGDTISFTPVNDNIYIDINLNKNKAKNLVDGDIISVIVGTDEFEGVYKAEFDKRIGHKDDPDIGVKELATLYGIDVDFDDEVIKEAEDLNKEITDEDLISRKDLRDLNIITIDCDDTKDRDDAVYTEKLENGNYRLVVSISDVSHYVKKGTKLYEAALSRNNSFYINNTCIPMFPRTLSNGICSLNENVDRLTKTVDMEIDREGNVVNYDIYDSVINSKKAMKYSEVNKLLENSPSSDYIPFIDSLKCMNELSHILEESRTKRNYLDFNLPDINVKLDEKGKAISFENSYQGEAEKLIENFMVITNNVVASHYSWLPFVYRVHEVPKVESVKQAIILLNLSGISIPNIQNINEESINIILDHVKNKEEALIVRELLLRTMKRARYDIKNVGHYALQLDSYCHFTSPIRRVSDFMVHFVITNINNIDYDNIEELESELNAVCLSASKSERIADSMEKEGHQMLMAEYMKNFIGYEFEGLITDVGSYGMAVKINDTIVGRVKLSNMNGDKFYFDKDKHAIIGKKSNMKFKLGHKTTIKVISASKEARVVDFETNLKEKVKKLEK